MNYSAHESTIIDQGAQIGKDTKIWHFCHISNSAVIGENCSIGQNCYIAGKIGNNCKIQNNVNIFEGVELENYVFCGPSTTFTNVLTPRAKYPVNKEYLRTIVGEGVSFGANSTIVCGTKIGKWAMIGAGTVVVKDIPDYALMVGNPARQIGWISTRGKKLDFDSAGYATCSLSGDKYELKEGVVKIIL